MFCKCSTCFPSYECLPRSYQLMSVRGDCLPLVTLSVSWVCSVVANMCPCSWALPNPVCSCGPAPRPNLCSWIQQLSRWWAFGICQITMMPPLLLGNVWVVGVGKCRLASLIKYRGIHFCKKLQRVIVYGTALILTAVQNSVLGVSSTS